MKRALTLVLGATVAFVVAGATDAASKNPAIGGYCPVAYVKMGKAVKGDARRSSERDGQVFLFSAPQAKELFDKSPDQFRVAYHGYRATGVAMGKRISSNPELFTVQKGVTYLFSSTEAKGMFDKDPDGTVAKADRNPLFTDAPGAGSVPGPAPGCPIMGPQGGWHGQGSMERLGPGREQRLRRPGREPLLPEGVRPAGVPAALGPPHGLPLEGAGELLRRGRRRQSQCERSLVLPGPEGGGARDPRARRLLEGRQGRRLRPWIC